LLICFVLGFRLWLWLRLRRRRRGILLVRSGSLEDVVVVSFLHEELSKMVLAVEDSIKRSIGTMCKRAPTVSTPEA
jgi:hypothetical protein